MVCITYNTFISTLFVKYILLTICSYGITNTTYFDNEALKYLLYYLFIDICFAIAVLLDKIINTLLSF